MKTIRTLALGTAFALLAAPALAHTGIGTTDDFSSGFLHPLGGLDHELAMVTVGLFAALLGGRAIWAVPAAFVGMMVAGGMLGFTGVAVPMVETGILASIIVLGGVVAFGLHLPVVAAMGLVGVFAIFHGHAHGAEMPADAGAVSYAVGFALATALLHAAGIGAGLLLFRRPLLIRAAGAAVAAAGIVMAVA